jgi:GTPase SAR1 family protein
MKTLFKLTKSIKLEKSLSTALSKLSLRMLIHILLENSDDLVSRTVMSLLSKQNPVPLFNPVSQEIKMIPEVYFLWNSDYPTVLSFGVGPCSGKSSLLNSLFMSSFEQHVKSIYFQNTIDIDFGYHFIAKRPLNIADIHGQPTKEIIEKLQVLFDGFIVQVTNDYLQKNTDQLFKFLSVLPVEKLRMIIVRDVPDDIDLNDNENCPDSLIPFSKFQLSDLRNQDDNQRESLVETLRNNIFRDIRISSHIVNSWSQYPIVRRYKKRAQIESLVDGICAEILRNSTTVVSNLKNHLIEAQKQAAKIKNEGFQKSKQDANLQAVIRSYYPVYILFVEYCRLIQQLTKTTFYGEQSDKIFEIQNISFQKNKQLENVKRHECGIIFEDFIQLLKKPNAAMLMNLDILSSELKLQKSILLSENLLAGDLSVENALSIEVLWRNAIVCYKYQPLDVQKYIKESYYRYIEAGFPFEIVDGDNFCLQYEFLLDALLNFQNKNILVISVIGPQNSGKSTLLNYMFGTLFNVRDGRCTRGIYGSLVKSNSTEFEYIMIIDTEGLSSGEKEDLEYDRRIVLFCLAVSHLVIINIKGELDSTMNRMVTLCAHSLQHLGVSRVPEPMVHFVLNQKAFGLDIKNHDTVINKLLQNLEKDGLDKVIEITTNTFHTLPTAYKPERLILNEEESKQIPSVAHTIPDYLEHVQLLCGKLMNSATKCFVKCKAHFSDAPQWLTFSNTVFNVLLKFPDLTYFVDIHEKNQDLVIREHIRQAIEKKLTLRQRQIIVDETRTMTEKKIEEHIDTFFGTILESLRLYLEETLKEHQASQTIRKRGNEFLNTQLTGNKNAWKTTALQANDRVKTEDLWHTGGEEMRELIEKIINSRKKYDEKTAKKIFEDTWNEKIYNIQRKFKEDERSEMAIKYIYPNYHSFETKNLPSSDHIVKFVREIKELNKLNFNELAANMRRIFIHEVSKYASIEEHRVVHSSLPEYSLEKLQGLTYLNEYVLCQLFSGKEYSQIDSPDVYYDAHAIQTTVSDSTHASESAKQPSMFSADNIKRFFNRFGLGISSKQEKYSDMSLIRSQWIAPSANEFRKKVIALLTNEKVQERGQKILPLLKTFDYIYDQIIKVLLENGTRVVSIEINIIQKIVGLINTFLKEINLELNLFYASLSKHVASAFHTVYVILLTKFYFKEQNDHLEQQIHTLQQMKAGLNSYFLRMVVPNIKMDSGFAKNSTNQIFDILHSILKEQADKIITDELQNETDFSREAIQKKCDTAHVGHQGINDIETIKWHIKYIINPNEIIRQGFEQVWKRKEEHIESLLKEERKKFAEVFDKYVSVLKYTLENIKKKTKYKSGVQFIDDLFETSTGEAGQNLINKGKCMALVLYNYLSNKKIEQNYTVGDIKYVLKDIDLFQILIPPDQSIIDLMNREQMRKGYEQCSINDFFEFLEKLIELGSVKKKEFESLPVDLVNMDSNDSKRKLLSKAKGCEILCPCCARPCDVDHTKIKAGFGSEFNKHQCRTGHQYRCMGGTKLEYTNEASIKMCEQIKGDDMIVVSTGRISWKEFKALRQDWDFETQHITAEELEKLRMKYATIWGIIGKTLCKDHYPGMVYVEANVDPTQHFILLLDNSGSMRADNRWSDLLDAVDKFLTIRKSSKTRDTTSIIIFGNEATIACSNEDIKSFDVMSKIKEKEGTVGGGTDFSKPIALIKDTIENANRKKIVTSLIHSVIFLSDGEASYPEAELKTLKANYGSVIENFWSMGLGSSHFIVLEQINTEMNGTFKNITDSKDLVTVYAEIAYGDSSKKAI